MRATGLIVACVSLVLASADGAAATTITAHGHQVTRIGPLRIAGRTVTPPVARRALGAGRTLVDVRGYCKMRWPARNLTLVFADFSASTRSTCEVGHLQDATLGAGGRTNRGLTVGARTSAIRRHYPRARRRGSTWLLMPYRSPIGASGLASPLRATVRHGRVARLEAWIGQAGE